MESTSIWYIHHPIGDNGFILKHKTGRFEIVRVCRAIPTLSDRNYKMHYWMFTDLKVDKPQLVNQANINQILGAIEDKYGLSLHDLSLGQISYEP